MVPILRYLLDQLEVIIDLLRTAFPPVILEPKHDNVRSQLSESGYLKHRLEAFSHVGGGHRDIEGFYGPLL